MFELHLPTNLYAALMGLMLALTALARVIDQGVTEFLRSEDGGINLFAWIARLFRRKQGRKRAGAAGGVAGAVAAAAIAGFVGPWEGLRTTAYQDIVGVWTVCYGETRGVGPGDAYTAAECDTQLARAVDEYRDDLTACLPNLGTYPEGVQIAFVSWTYNVGAGAACGSTLVRKAKAGDLVGACNELPRWNKAGGRVVRGLTNRRAAEQSLCLEALR